MPISYFWMIARLDLLRGHAVDQPSEDGILEHRTPKGQEVRADVEVVDFVLLVGRPAALAARSSSGIGSVNSLRDAPRVRASPWWPASPPVAGLDVHAGEHVVQGSQQVAGVVDEQHLVVGRQPVPADEVARQHRVGAEVVGAVPDRPGLHGDRRAACPARRPADSCRTDRRRRRTGPARAGRSARPRRPFRPRRTRRTGRRGGSDGPPAAPPPARTPEGSGRVSRPCGAAGARVVHQRVDVVGCRVEVVGPVPPDVEVAIRLAQLPPAVDAEVPEQVVGLGRDGRDWRPRRSRRRTGQRHRAISASRSDRSASVGHCPVLRWLSRGLAPVRHQGWMQGPVVAGAELRARVLSFVRTVPQVVQCWAESGLCDLRVRAEIPDAIEEAGLPQAPGVGDLARRGDALDQASLGPAAKAARTAFGTGQACVDVAGQLGEGLSRSLGLRLLLRQLLDPLARVGELSTALTQGVCEWRSLRRRCRHDDLPPPGSGLIRIVRRAATSRESTATGVRDQGAPSRPDQRTPRPRLPDAARSRQPTHQMPDAAHRGDHRLGEPPPAG